MVPWVTLKFESNNKSEHKVYGDATLVYEKDVHVGGGASVSYTHLRAHET